MTGSQGIDHRVLRTAEEVTIFPHRLTARVGSRHLEADSESLLHRRVWRAMYEEFHAGLGPSARGGVVGMRVDGDRVVLSGTAVTVIEASLLHDPR